VIALAAVGSLTALATHCLIEDLDLGGPSARAECADSSQLRASLERASPGARGWMLFELGETADPCYRDILLEYAADGRPLVEQFPAQRELMFHYPESWPYEARETYVALVGHDRYREWFGYQPPGPSSAWYKSAITAWGLGAWDPGHPWYGAVAPSAEWEAFLDDFGHFMSADDAAWQLARAYHYEGHPRRAVETLEMALHLPDGDADQLVWQGLRHYLVEEVDEADLERWMGEPEWEPPTAYAIRYARGLRHFWNLELERAAETWSALERVELESTIHHYAHWGRRFGENRERDRLLPPEERIALSLRLVPFERRWRARFDTDEEGTAFIDLAEAILAEASALPRGVGIFEPWILIDTEINHPVANVLVPPLEAYVALGLDAESEGRARFIIAALRADVRWGWPCNRGPGSGFGELAVLGTGPRASAGGGQATADLGHDHACGLYDRFGAADAFRTLADDLPDHWLAPQALFFWAILSFDHQDKVLELVERYPDSPWADHAEWWSRHWGNVDLILDAYRPLPPRPDPPPIDQIAGAGH
jgi:hypothetical protein